MSTIFRSLENRSKTWSSEVTQPEPTNNTPLSYTEQQYQLFVEHYLGIFEELEKDVYELKAEISSLNDNLYEITIDFLSDFYEKTIKDSLSLGYPTIDVYSNSIDLHFTDKKYSLLINLDLTHYSYSIQYPGGRDSGGGEIFSLKGIYAKLLPFLRTLRMR